MKILRVLFLAFITLFTFENTFAQRRIDVGAEVWIEPGQTPEELDMWFSRMADNKMRSARIFLMWNYIETSPTTYDFSIADMAFEAAKKHGVEIEASLFCTHAPTFYGEQYWYRTQRHTLLWSREIQEASAKFIEACVTRYRNHPALGTWWILNEARGFTATSPLAVEFTQDWVRKKYGTIERLNEAWRTDYKSFEEVKYEERWVSNRSFMWTGANYDWCDIQRDFLTYNFRWIGDQIRKHDSKHPVTTNPADFFFSADKYDLAEHRNILDIFGASMHAAWQLRAMNRDQYGYAVSGICEILRAHAPNNHFWVSEMQGGNNIFSGQTPICPDRNDLAQWVWSSIGTGARKVIYWSSNYRRQSGEAGEWGVFGFKGEDTDRSLVTKEINEVLEKHGDFFAESKPELSNITLILSPETQRMLRHIRNERVGVREWDIMAQTRTTFMWYEALLELGCQPQMRYMSDYEWEKHGKGDVVVIANAATMPSDIIPRIEKFVERGGKVIIEGLTGFYDEKAECTLLHKFGIERLVGGVFEDIRYRETPQYFSIESIGKVQGHAWHPIVRATAPTATVIGNGAEGDVALHNCLGEGEVWWLTPSISMSCAARNNSSELATVCKALLGKDITAQPFRFAEFADSALMRTLRKGDDYITILTNNKRTPCTLKLIAPKGLTATPIFGTARFSKSGRVSLGDRETLVLRWK
ncbi:MAG: hypothetical protein E7141_01000 [Rikenellaceae bacterium]|nr:hypothetical protein [Rikenellaceae bacterium]